MDRLLIGLWLLANTVLISIYSGELFNNVIKGKVIDKIDSIEQLVTKEHWKDSKVILGDWGICDLISCNHEIGHGNSLISNLWPKGDILNPFDLFMDENYRNNIFMSVLTENNVIIANKLSTYYLLRKLQSESTDFMSLYTEGTDYYVSEPKSSSKPFHFVYFDVNNHINDFNRTLVLFGLLY